MNIGAAVAVLGGTAAAGVALDLAARRTIRRHEDLDPESARLPGSRFWVRGEAVHYVEQGRGFPVVLVHGFGGSTFSYRYTLPALAKRFRVLAIDLPGFGYSGRSKFGEYSQSGWAALLHEFIERQGIHRAVLVGHSLGGAVVQRLAAAHPELAERLVLVSSVSAGEPPAGAAVRPYMPLVRAVQALLAVRPGLVRSMARRIVYDPQFVTDDIMSAYLRPSRVPGSAAAFRNMMLNLRREGPIDLATIHAPTLLIWGERDRTVKSAVAERLHRMLAGSRLEIVPRAGHLPLEERPEMCNRLILDFISDLAGSQPQGTGSASGTTR